MFESIRNLFSPKKEEPVRKHYDPETQKPAIRCSICTGEQVAGFQDLKTGKFLEIQLLRNSGVLSTDITASGVMRNGDSTTMICSLRQRMNVYPLSRSLPNYTS